MRRAIAILSVVLLFVPLPIGFTSAYRILNHREAYTSSRLSIAAQISEDLSRYTGMLIIGMFGFVLAGICLDGMNERSKLYFFWLVTAVGFWLIYFPVGSIFGTEIGTG
jgi:ammonia channel protein AmtB